MGYIYNDSSGTDAAGIYSNTLHAASCSTLGLANLYVDKYFTPDLEEAVLCLNANRGNNWTVCPVCAPSHELPVGADPRRVGLTDELPTTPGMSS